jgi:hypothetical protein
MNNTFLLLLIAALFCIGCSNNNKVSIVNIAEGQIIVNFRGDLYPVDAGSRQSITDIANGSYPYTTTYAIPAGKVGSASEGLSGTLVFTHSSTVHQLLYSAAGDDSTYILGATLTSNDDIGAKTPVSPTQE